MKLFTLLFCLMLATPALADDLYAAKLALERGDYATALKEIRPLAAQGNAWAQYNLGVAYDTGKGTLQDKKQAVQWYKKSAAQGDTDAQNNLGIMYGIGEGVDQDFVKAHMWTNLAAASGDAGAVKMRDIIVKLMTSRQIKQARKMARECLANNYKGC